MATRKYEQRLRAEGAEQTRLRIIEAVHERLTSAPAEPINIDQIAKIARVARPTIYSVFGSRSGLFDALGHDLLERGGFERVRESAAHPDALQGMRDGITAIVELYAAYRDVLRALFSMAALDSAAVAGAIGRLEDGRAVGMADLASRLRDQQRLAPDLGATHATDVLWILTSFDSFDLLYTGRGRSPDRTAATLILAAERAVCRA